jgi:ankyrin repeat protein
MAKQNELQEAIGRNDYARVEELVAAGRKLTIDQANDWLSHALAGGPTGGPPDFRQAKLALRAGADVNHESETAMGGNITEFDTLLTDFAASGNLEVVKFLVDNGADVNAVRYSINDNWEEDSDDPDEDEPPKEDVQTPLSMAAREGKRDVYDYLWPLTVRKHQKNAEKLKTW